MGNNGHNGKPPVIMGTVHIDLLDDGTVRVRNFPNNYMQALGVMQLALTSVCTFFMQREMAGEMQQQKILRPGLGINPDLLKG